MRHLVTTRNVFGLCLVICITSLVCRAQNVVRGTVTTDAGPPPPYRDVKVLLIAKGRPPRTATVTARSGEFVIERVSDDKFQLVACAGRDYVPDVRDVDIKEGKPILLTLIYAKNRQDLRGTVKDKRITTVYAVAYECQLADAKVNQQGRYEFRDMPRPPEKYAYAIETSDGKRLQTAAIAPTGDRQEIALNLVRRQDGFLELNAELVTAVTVDPSSNGVLAGRVTDPQGHNVGGVSVEVTSRDTNMTRTVTTNDAGEFAATVPMGIYDVRVEGKGFGVSRVENVLVAFNQTTLDMALDIGNIGDTVTIGTGALDNLVDTPSSSTVLEGTVVRELPLKDRNFGQLLSLGVGSTSGPAGFSRVGDVSVNGNSPSANTFIIDSANYDGDALGLARMPSPEVPFEAVDKVTISLHEQPELGRSSGGSVITQTKGGTNELRGSAFYWNRHSALAARDFFERDKAHFLTHHFGVALGGPIGDYPFYYFGSYEGKREVQARPRLLSVPSPATLATARSILSAHGLVENALSTRLLTFFPQADREAVFNNRSINSSVINDSDNFIIRLDSPHAKHNTTVVYNFVQTDQIYPLSPSFIPGFRTEFSGRTQSLSGTWSYTVTPAVLNELVIRYDRNRENFRPEDHDFNPSTIGLNSGVSDSQRFGLPLIKITGFDALGSPFELPTRQVRSSLQVNDVLFVKLGSHTVRLGGDLRRSVVDSNNDAGTRGRIVFDGSILGNPLADFLAGFPSGNTAIVRGDTDRRLAINFANWFVQDEFKPIPSLTLNFGVRYGLNSAPNEKLNQLSSFIPDVGLVQIGSPQLNKLFKKDLTNVGPRFSVAWDPTRSEDFAIRAGWGLYFNSPSLSLFSALCPCSNSPNAGVTFNPAGSRPTFALSPSGPIPFGIGVPIFDGPALIDLSAVDPNLKNPYVHDFYFGAQTAVTSRTSLEAIYAGSFGRRLYRIVDINQPTPGDRTTRDSRRPFFTQFPQFGVINSLTSSGRSTYHALQVSLQRHVSTGLWWNGAYTFSKSINDVSYPYELPQNSRDIRAERALSGFDQRHRLVLAFSYNTGPSREYAVLKFWEFSGILRLASGNPFTPLISFDNSGTATFMDRPNLLSDARVRGSRTQLYTSTAFGFPPAGTFGNVGRNSLAGPGLNSLDVSLKKRIPFSNDRYVEFRAEVFNLFNHPNFILPNNFVDEPAFGTIVATNPDHARRKLQFGIRLEF